MFIREGEQRFANQIYTVDDKIIRELVMVRIKGKSNAVL